MQAKGAHTESPFRKKKIVVTKSTTWITFATHFSSYNRHSRLISMGGGVLEQEMDCLANRMYLCDVSYTSIRISQYFSYHQSHLVYKDT